MTHVAECSAIRESLSAYLDGEVRPRRREEIDAHLAACAVCRGELEALRRISTCLQDWPAPAVSPTLSAAFEERLKTRAREDAHRPKAGWWPRAAWAVGLAASLVLAVTCYRIGQGPQAEKTDRTEHVRTERVTVISPSTAPLGKGGDVVPGATDMHEAANRIQPAPASGEARLQHEQAAYKADAERAIAGARRTPEPPAPDPTMTAVAALAGTEDLTALAVPALPPASATLDVDIANDADMDAFIVDEYADGFLPGTVVGAPPPAAATAYALLAEVD